VSGPLFGAADGRDYDGFEGVAQHFDSPRLHAIQDVAAGGVARVRSPLALVGVGIPVDNRRPEGKPLRGCNARDEPNGRRQKDKRSYHSPTL
jgi:hypothetical protein